MQAQHNTKKNDTIDCIKYILNGLFYIMRHHISVLSRGILDFNWRENIINDIQILKQKSFEEIILDEL